MVLVSKFLFGYVDVCSDEFFEPSSTVQIVMVISFAISFTGCYIINGGVVSILLLGTPG